MVNVVGKCVSLIGNYAIAMDFPNGHATNNATNNGTANGPLVFRASDA